MKSPKLGCKQGSHVGSYHTPPCTPTVDSTPPTDRRHVLPAPPIIPCMFSRKRKKNHSVYVHRSTSHGTRIYGTYIKVAIRIAICMPVSASAAPAPHQGKKKKNRRHAAVTAGGCFLAAALASRAQKQASTRQKQKQNAVPGDRIASPDPIQSLLPNGRSAGASRHTPSSFGCQPNQANRGRACVWCGVALPARQHPRVAPGCLRGAAS